MSKKKPDPLEVIHRAVTNLFESVHGIALIADTFQPVPGKSYECSPALAGVLALLVARFKGVEEAITDEQLHRFASVSEREVTVGDVKGSSAHETVIRLSDRFVYTWFVKGFLAKSEQDAQLARFAPSSFTPQQLWERKWRLGDIYAELREFAGPELMNLGPLLRREFAALTGVQPDWSVHGLKVSEVAALRECSPATVTRACDAGKLASTGKGKARRIPVNAARAFRPQHRDEEMESDAHVEEMFKLNKRGS